MLVVNVSLRLEKFGLRHELDKAWFVARLEKGNACASNLFATRMLAAAQQGRDAQREKDSHEKANEQELSHATDAALLR